MLPIRRLFIFMLVSITTCTIINAQWIQTNGPYGGNVYSFMVKDAYVFAGTANGGVFRSSDNGLNWTPVNSGINQYRSIYSLISKGEYIFAGTNGGVYRSSNNGDSWTYTNTGLENSYAQEFAVINNDILAGTNYGVYRSTNNGDSWTAINTGLSYPYVTAFALTDTNVLIGTREGIYRSNKNTFSWTLTSVDVEGTYIYDILVSGSDIYTATEWGVCLSTDQGQHWTLVQNNLNGNFIYALAEYNGNIYAGDNFNGVFRTSNKGQTWEAVSDGLTNTKVNALINLGSAILVGTMSMGIHRSGDGANWTKSNTGLAATIITDLLEMPDGAGSKYIFATTSDGIFRSHDNGMNWTITNTGLTTPYMRSIIKAGKWLFASSPEGVFRSSNYGGDWSLINDGLTDIYVVDLLAVKTKTGDTCIFAGTNKKGIFRNNKTGSSTWEAVNNGLTRTYIDFLAVSDTNIFAAASARLFISSNNGELWNMKPSAWQNFGITDMAFSSDGTHIFLGAYLLGALRSTDTCNTWTEIQSGMPDHPYTKKLCAYGTNIFAGMDLYGVYLTKNNGGSWIEVNTNLDYKTISSLKVFDNDLFAGTTGGGVWKRPLSEMVTNINNAALNVPDLDLGQNFPNPAKQTTTIPFKLAAKAFVSLQVFDAWGRQVANLQTGELSRGSYERIFNTENLSNGVYFYRLQAGRFVKSKKFVVSR